MKKYIKISIIFLIIFICFATGITAFLIINHNPKSDNSNYTVSHTPEVITEKTAKLDETYNLNDLKITEYKEKQENQEFTYVQIDGLKDERIEISINYSLKEDVKSKFLESLNAEDYNSDLYCYTQVCGNFANVFSMYYIVEYKNKSEEFTTYRICENFDLTTGNRLQITDVILNTRKNSSAII